MITLAANHPIWRHFENIPSGAEAASAGACCAFSLSTLEMTSLDGVPGFAITERQQPLTWRWAIVGADGSVLEEGTEPTQDDAKAAAAEALILVIEESAMRASRRLPLPVMG